MHDGEEEDEHTMTEETSNNVQTINLTVKHAMIGVFVLGLSVGFALGTMFSGPVALQQNTGTTTNPTDDGQNNNNNQDTGSDVSGSTPKEVFMNIGDKVGADTDQLNSCYEQSTGEESSEDTSYIDQKIREVIDQRNLSRSPGLGTPTFLIGNNEIGYRVVEGAQTIDRMRPVIQEQLQSAQNPESDSINQGNPFGGNGEITIDESQLEGEPTKGEENAPVRVIEYSDFGCPWCAEWFGVDAIPQRNVDGAQSYDKLMSEFVDTGDVQFTYMDLPRPRLHPNAPDAHKAANCVLEQDEDLYWDYHDMLYEERDQWMSG